MRSTPASLLLFALLLAIGYGAGWWTRGLSLPTRPGFGDVASPHPVESVAGAQRPASIPASRPSAPLQQQRADTPATFEHQPEPTSQAGAEPASPTAEAERDLRARFQQLLDERAFDAAMDVYTQIERRSARDAETLRQAVLQRVRRYLAKRDESGTTALISAWLSRYYSDLDMLLLLAQHHLQSGFATEAARTYQLAFSYAVSGADEQQVQAAFAAFVQDVDQSLSGQQRWQELISFYDTLALLDLTQPRYQLRQAELYLTRGEARFGRDLLRRLLDEPAVAAQAQALLEDRQASARRTPAQPGESVALSTYGEHYVVPVGLNRGQTAHLVIDTGASTTTLTRTAFERLSRESDAELLGPQLFNTANGMAEAMVYRLDRVRIGSQVLPDVQVAVLDFDTPDGVDGLLGMNILRHFHFQVDQDEQQLRLQPRQDLP